MILSPRIKSDGPVLGVKGVLLPAPTDTTKDNVTNSNFAIRDFLVLTESIS